jgi:protease-4
VRPLEPDELAMLQSLASSFHTRLRRQIHAARPGIAVETEIFDGRVFDGEQALASGLIDRLGYLDDAVATARGLARLGDDAAVVMLRRDNDRAHSQFDVTPNSPQQTVSLPLNVPGLDREQLPTFLYIWQPETSLVTASGG